MVGPLDGVPRALGGITWAMAKLNTNRKLRVISIRKMSYFFISLHLLW
jgi:hypothetical protein